MGAVLGSAVAHLLLLCVLVLQRPTLPPPRDIGETAPEIIPVLIMPRSSKRVPDPARPAPLRLHRALRRAPEDAPTAPLVAAPRPGDGDGAGTSQGVGQALHPAPEPEGPKGDVRAALRHSPVGCANALAVGLNAAERAACDEALGKGAKTAPVLGLGIPADKAAAFDAAAAHKAACRAYHQVIGQPNPPLRDGLC